VRLSKRVKDLETELEAVKKDGLLSGSGSGGDGKSGTATVSLRCCDARFVFRCVNCSEG
jgi:hypothetical protein